MYALHRKECDYGFLTGIHVVIRYLELSSAPHKFPLEVNARRWWPTDRDGIQSDLRLKQCDLQISDSLHRRDGWNEEREHQGGQSSLEKKASQFRSKVKTWL